MGGVFKKRRGGRGRGSHACLTHTPCLRNDLSIPAWLIQLGKLPVPRPGAREGSAEKLLRANGRRWRISLCLPPPSHTLNVSMMVATQGWAYATTWSAASSIVAG